MHFIRRVAFHGDFLLIEIWHFICSTPIHFTKCCFISFHLMIVVISCCILISSVISKIPSYMTLYIPLLVIIVKIITVEVDITNTVNTVPSTEEIHNMYV